ncbi:MAG: hypothetical protein JWN04_4694 [Myxococcaceae bacterium]|nr:hypothetical protein [Myxococcaceae bacterium]
MATTSVIGGLAQMAGANQGGPVLDMIDDILAAADRTTTPETSTPSASAHDATSAGRHDGERVADALRSLFARVDDAPGADPSWVERSDGLRGLSEAQRASVDRSFQQLPQAQAWEVGNYVHFMQEARAALVIANARGDSRCLAWLAHDNGKNQLIDLSANDRAAASRLYSGSIASKRNIATQNVGGEAEYIATMRRGTAVLLRAHRAQDRRETTAQTREEASRPLAANETPTESARLGAPGALENNTQRVAARVAEVPEPPLSARVDAPALAELAASHRTTARAPAAEVARAPRQAQSQFETFGALSAAANRLEVLARETAEARVRDTQKHKEQQLPVQEPEPHRREVLREASDPQSREGVPKQYRPTLTQLDRKVARIREDIVNNPMWINSAFLTRAGTKRGQGDFMTDQEALRENADLRSARDRALQGKQQHQKDLKTSQREIRRLEAFQRQAPWLRWAQNKLLDRENKLTKTAESAADREHASQAELANLKQLATGLYAAHNTLKEEQARESYERALARRHEIEQPLREAVLERAIAEQAVVANDTPLRVRDALDGETMSLESVKAFGELTQVAVFRTASQHPFFVDLQEHRAEVGSLAIGDVVTVSKNEFGARQLAVTERGNAWPHNERVEGRVSALRREGDKLKGVEVADAAGIRKWVVPQRGNDLNDELGRSRAQLSELAVGDGIRISATRGERSLHVVSKGREQSRGR